MTSLEGLDDVMTVSVAEVQVSGAGHLSPVTLCTSSLEILLHGQAQKRHWKKLADDFFDQNNSLRVELQQVRALSAQQQIQSQRQVDELKAQCNEVIESCCMQPIQSL